MRITRPAILMLSYGRHDMTSEVLRQNLQTTGMPSGLFVADIRGIAKATNTLLVRAKQEGYDGFVVCGNDIIEPDNWLKKRVDFINKNRECGLVSIPVDKFVDAPSPEMVIGNFMFSLDVLLKLGGMDERFDPYGAIDLDYNKRCNAAGFINYYLPNYKAYHMDIHDGQDVYGYNKQDMVKKTWHLHTAPIENYNIPIIEMEQFK